MPLFEQNNYTFVINENSERDVKDFIDVVFGRIENLFSVGWKAGLFYGGLWLVVYCFLAINFFPTGLSASEVLFIVFLAVAFGVCVLFLGIFGMLTLWPLIFVFDKNYRSMQGSNAIKFCRKYMPLLGVIIFIGLTVYVGVAYLIYRWQAMPLWIPRYEIVWNLVFWLFFLGMMILFFGLYARNKGYGFSEAVGMAFISSVYWCFLVYFLQNTPERNESLFYIVATIGVFLLALVSIKKSPETGEVRIKNYMKVVAAIAFLPFLYSIPVKSNEVAALMRIVFGGFGVYKEGPILLIKGDSVDVINGLKSSFGLDVVVCNVEKDQLMVAGFDMLWGGPGVRTLLSVSQENKISNFAKIKLNSDNVLDQEGLVRFCADLEGKVYFDLKKHIPLDSAQISELREHYMKAVIRLSDKWIVDSLEFVGRTDPMPAHDNLNLSRRRAEEVCNQFWGGGDNSNAFECSSSMVKVQAIGSIDAKNFGCQSIKEKMAAAECNLKNRYVSLRINFKRRGV